MAKTIINRIGITVDPRDATILIQIAGRIPKHENTVANTVKQTHTVKTNQPSVAKCGLIPYANKAAANVIIVGKLNSTDSHCIHKHTFPVIRPNATDIQ